MIKKSKKNNRWSSLLLGLLFLLFQLSLYAQKGGLIFENISLPEGLPQSAVFCIQQDQAGFMWFATQDGLCRYDGYQFKIFRHHFNKPFSISDHNVWSILEDKEGFLWVGTLNGGLNKFDPTSEKFVCFQNQPTNPKSLSCNDVRCIYQDKKGTLWVGTNGGGLNRLVNAEKGVFESYPNGNHFSETLPENKIWSISQYDDGMLLLGTDKGLVKFDARTKQFTPFPKKISPTQISTTYKVRSIFKDHLGQIWIGEKEGGLNTIDNKNKILLPYGTGENNFGLSQSSVWCMVEDANNILWIGTDKGLYKYDPSTGELSNYTPNPSMARSLSDNDIRAIFQDRSGVIWLGTYGGGVNKLVPKNSGFSIYSHDARNPNSLSNNKVWSFAEDYNKAIWIGTESGLNKFDPNQGTCIRYKSDPQNKEGLNSNKIQSIYRDNQGQLWIGTFGGGLSKLLSEEKGGCFKPYTNEPNRSDSLSDNDICVITQDQNHVYWIGTLNNGINLLENPDKNSFKHYKKNDSSHLSHNSIRCIFVDRKGEVWVGTEGGGLNKFDREKKEFTHFENNPNDPLSLSGNRVTCIYEDKKNILWIATNGGGLNQLIDGKKGVFNHYREEDNPKTIPNNTIYGILEDEQGHLWLCTNKGLCRFNPNDKTYRYFDAYDGLQSNEFNTGAFFKSSKGAMYFGGIKGFNVFNPTEITTDDTPPQVVLTDFFISNRSVPLQWEDPTSPIQTSIHTCSAITLKHAQNMFTFEFAALHYAAPAKNQYRYQLQNFDKQWITTDVTNRRATYTNLPAGDYIFKVKGSNKDGIWSSTESAIKIKILPPWWKTWWAYSLYLLALGGIVLWFVWSQWRKTSIERRAKEELEIKVAERTLDLAQKKEALAKINTIVKAINSKLQLPDLLLSILEETKVIKGVEKATALVWEPQTGQFVINASSGLNKQEVSGISFTPQQAKERYLEDSEEIYPDIFLATHIHLRPHQDKITHLEAPQAMLIARIRLEEETLAYFIFENMKDENAFVGQDIELLNNLKEHFVAAFQKARLISLWKNTQNQLEQAQKMVSLGMMTAEIAHELKNPASVIKMNVEYFSHVWLDIVEVLEQFAKNNSDFEIANLPFQEVKTEIENLLKTLLDHTKNLQNLIEELRTYSKKEDTMTQENIHINPVIQSTLHLTRSLIMKSTKHFSTQLAEDLPPIRGNYQKLQQVMVNLIQNACQALPDISRGIHISTSYDTDGKHISIKIKDEGVGIEEWNLKHLAEPFFTTKSGSGGIGLGLAISSRIIKEHGGTMEFVSKLGQGTIVSVFLPIGTLEEKKTMEG